MIETLIARFVTVYGEPRTDDPGSFLNEFSKALQGFKPSIMERVGDETIRQIGPFWPRPAEVVAIAQRIADSKAADDRRAANARQQFESRGAENAISPEAKARAQAIMDEYLNNRKEAGRGRPSFPFEKVQRPGFEAMQRNSPNQYLHRAPLRNGRGA